MITLNSNQIVNKNGIKRLFLKKGLARLVNRTYTLTSGLNKVSLS
jgi:hypothetical protein